jgi:SNF family Na+-dependent transporter
MFGGLLGLINFFGGLVLFVLIGNKAWDSSSTARHFRLAFGGIAVGLASTIVFVIYLAPEGGGGTLCLFPLIVVLCVFGLEILREKLGGNKD